MPPETRPSRPERILSSLLSNQSALGECERSCSTMNSWLWPINNGRNHSCSTFRASPKGNSRATTVESPSSNHQNYHLTDTYRKPYEQTRNIRTTNTRPGRQTRPESQDRPTG